ncbi:hypothetical protein jhhlp_002310 [Lomentospora prolificans]|uniref:F-box domain-containing protein n=1 Tax=Lomentospora prolificans TaxID=41688 RepID=A0A2N3NDL0_9PEZI|nr:hypothetical protein jhhlp_002310 [Lomentospora prolificans]
MQQPIPQLTPLPQHPLSNYCVVCFLPQPTSKKHFIHHHSATVAALLQLRTIPDVEYLQPSHFVRFSRAAAPVRAAFLTTREPSATALFSLAPHSLDYAPVVPNMTKSTQDMASADVSADGGTSAVPSESQMTASHFQSDESSLSGPSQLSVPPASCRPETAPKQVVEKLLKGKEVVGKALAERSGKLTLLELPVDILRLIVHEITHTNDLTSLALTNSTLYSLAVPQIYSRFDIVWPDSDAVATESKSVDALTYGLSTLCLGSSFARRTHLLRDPGASAPTEVVRQLRKNSYAQYTRKFSLGNGPPDWVTEYLISKESGKMLCTLVALAVEKMVNLETFVWDMPTGVLSDVFLALGSHQDRLPDAECKLERVWVRWHDSYDDPSAPENVNRDSFLPQTSIPPTATLTPVGILLPLGTEEPPRPSTTMRYNDSRVEYPTFSVLPPLRSLTVLEIDDVAYLDEMSTLIERSKSRLQELRVGIGSRVVNHDFVKPWDGSNLHQVDHDAHWPGASTIGERRLGGVLGVLFGRIYDIRRKAPSKAGADPESSTTNQSQAEVTAVSYVEITNPWAHGHGLTATGSIVPTLETTSMHSPSSQNGYPDVPPRSSSKDSAGMQTDDDRVRKLDGKLKLRTLELERVPLSMQVCTKAIDWTTLTTLTLLDCPYHESLWKVLKRQFAPTSNIAGLRDTIAVEAAPSSSLQYFLALKHIHTDQISTALMTFIKETLSPNSLEVLFLHDRRRTPSPSVAIDQIFKSVIVKHRSSLRKLLLDSSEKRMQNGAGSYPLRWRHWAPTTDMVLYLTSGKMAKLTELSIALYYKDWHSFLQRLPNIPHLRSLNLPDIAITDRVAYSSEPKELALQIVDIVTLRPEIELCYVGLSSKCFEIYESEPRSRVRRGRRGSSDTLSSPAQGSNASSFGGDDDDTASLVSVHTAEESIHGGTTPNSFVIDETESEASLANDSDAESFKDLDLMLPKCEYRAREILFFDEVAIFKARHAKL